MRFLSLSLFCIMGLWSSAQTTLITGIVMDENNKPVANAQIDVVGKNTNTITDDNGKFALTLRKTAKGDLIIIRTTKKSYVVSSVRQAVSELPITIKIYGSKGSGDIPSKKLIDMTRPVVNAPNAQIVTMNQSGGNNTVINSIDSFWLKETILKSTPPKILPELNLDKNGRINLNITCLNKIPITCMPFVSRYDRDLAVGGYDFLGPLTVTPIREGQTFFCDLGINIKTWDMPKDSVSKITLIFPYESIYYKESGNPLLKYEIRASYQVDPVGNKMELIEKHIIYYK